MFAWKISICGFINNTFLLLTQSHASFPKNSEQVISFQSVQCEVLVLSDTFSAVNYLDKYPDPKNVIVH